MTPCYCRINLAIAIPNAIAEMINAKSVVSISYPLS